MSSKSYAFFLSITAALGGFLFGFDTAVISGAERAIQEVWKLSDLAHGLVLHRHFMEPLSGHCLEESLQTNLEGRKAFCGSGSFTSYPLWARE